MSAETFPVTFPNASGERLFGMVHLPAAARPDGTAILLLSPGVKMRVAPHRLYKKMADAFADMGYPVLRFDFHGLGDAEGEITEELLAEFYGTVQVGRYVGDTVAAMDYMQRAHGVTKFVAAGLCGGAITGLLAAERDPRITSLLGLAIPVILDSPGVDASRYMTVGELQGIRGGYLRKLTLRDPDVWKSWGRLLSGRSDYRMLARSLAAPVLSRLRRSPAPAPSAAPPADNTNPMFAPALLQMLRSSRRVFLVFAASDRLHWEFEAKFVARHGSELERYRDVYAVHVTPDANHIFSLPEWQADMLAHACRWLAGEAVGASSRAAAV